LFLEGSQKLNSFNLVAFKSETPIQNGLAGALGKLLFNCGLLELLSKNWIWELEQKNEQKRTKLCDELWKRRSTGLKKLIKEKLDGNHLKPKLTQAIDDTGKLMDFRNSSLMVLCQESDPALFLLWYPAGSCFFPRSSLALTRLPHDTCRIRRRQNYLLHAISDGSYRVPRIAPFLPHAPSY